MTCDCEKLKALLAKTADELDSAWSMVDSQFRISSDPPDPERAALVAEIEALVPYRFVTRS
jgi:hypothetical protein